MLGSAGRQLLGRGEEGVEVVALPLAHALLEQPQPADVAEEAGAAVDADLVGEVRRPRGVA